MTSRRLNRVRIESGADAIEERVMLAGETVADAPTTVDTTGATSNDSIPAPTTGTEAADVAAATSPSAATDATNSVAPVDAPPESSAPAPATTASAPAATVDTTSSADAPAPTTEEVADNIVSDPAVSETEPVVLDEKAQKEADKLAKEQAEQAEKEAEEAQKAFFDAEKERLEQAEKDLKAEKYDAIDAAKLAEDLGKDDLSQQKKDVEAQKKADELTKLEVDAEKDRIDAEKQVLKEDREAAEAAAKQAEKDGKELLDQEKKTLEAQKKAVKDGELDFSSLTEANASPPEPSLDLTAANAEPLSVNSTLPATESLPISAPLIVNPPPADSLPVVVAPVPPSAAPSVADDTITPRDALGPIDAGPPLEAIPALEPNRSIAAQAPTSAIPLIESSDSAIVAASPAANPTATLTPTPTASVPSSAGTSGKAAADAAVTPTDSLSPSSENLAGGASLIGSGGAEVNGSSSDAADNLNLPPVGSGPGLAPSLSETAVRTPSALPVSSPSGNLPSTSASNVTLGSGALGAPAASESSALTEFGGNPGASDNTPVSTRANNVGSLNAALAEFGAEVEPTIPVSANVAAAPAGARPESSPTSIGSSDLNNSAVGPGTVDSSVVTAAPPQPGSLGPAAGTNNSTLATTGITNGTAFNAGANSLGGAGLGGGGSAASGGGGGGAAAPAGFAGPSSQPFATSSPTSSQPLQAVANNSSALGNPAALAPPSFSPDAQPLTSEVAGNANVGETNAPLPTSSSVPTSSVTAGAGPIAEAPIAGAPITNGTAFNAGANSLGGAGLGGGGGAASGGGGGGAAAPAGFAGPSSQPFATSSPTSSQPLQAVANNSSALGNPAALAPPSFSPDAQPLPSEVAGNANVGETNAPLPTSSSVPTSSVTAGAGPIAEAPIAGAPITNGTAFNAGSNSLGGAGLGGGGGAASGGGGGGAAAPAGFAGPTSQRFVNSSPASSQPLQAVANDTRSLGNPAEIPGSVSEGGASDTASVGGLSAQGSETSIGGRPSSSTFGPVALNPNSSPAAASSGAIAGSSAAAAGLPVAEAPNASAGSRTGQSNSGSLSSRAIVDNEATSGPSTSANPSARNGFASSEGSSPLAASAGNAANTSGNFVAPQVGGQGGRSGGGGGGAGGTGPSGLASPNQTASTIGATPARSPFIDDSATPQGSLGNPGDGNLFDKQASVNEQSLAWSDASESAESQFDSSFSNSAALREFSNTNAESPTRELLDEMDNDGDLSFRSGGNYDRLEDRDDDRSDRFDDRLEDRDDDWSDRYDDRFEDLEDRLPIPNDFEIKSLSESRLATEQSQLEAPEMPAMSELEMDEDFGTSEPIDDREELPAPVDQPEQSPVRDALPMDADRRGDSAYDSPSALSFFDRVKDTGSSVVDSARALWTSTGLGGLFGTEAGESVSEITTETAPSESKESPAPNGNAYGLDRGNGPKAKATIDSAVVEMSDIESASPSDDALSTNEALKQKPSPNGNAYGLNRGNGPKSKATVDSAVVELSDMKSASSSDVALSTDEALQRNPSPNGNAYGLVRGNGPKAVGSINAVEKSIELNATKLAVTEATAVEGNAELTKLSSELNGLRIAETTEVVTPVVSLDDTIAATSAEQNSADPAARESVESLDLKPAQKAVQAQVTPLDLRAESSATAVGFTKSLSTGGSAADSRESASSNTKGASIAKVLTEESLSEAPADVQLDRAAVPAAKTAAADKVESNLSDAPDAFVSGNTAPAPKVVATSNAKAIGRIGARASAPESGRSDVETAQDTSFAATEDQVEQATAPENVDLPVLERLTESTQRIQAERVTETAGIAAPPVPTATPIPDGSDSIDSLSLNDSSPGREVNVVNTTSASEPVSTVSFETTSEKDLVAALSSAEASSEAATSVSTTVAAPSNGYPKSTSAAESKRVEAPVSEALAAAPLNATPSSAQRVEPRVTPNEGAADSAEVVESLAAADTNPAASASRKDIVGPVAINESESKVATNEDRAPAVVSNGKSPRNVERFETSNPAPTIAAWTDATRVYDIDENTLSNFESNPAAASSAVASDNASLTAGQADVAGNDADLNKEVVNRAVAKETPDALTSDSDQVASASTITTGVAGQSERVASSASKQTNANSSVVSKAAPAPAQPQFVANDAPLVVFASVDDANPVDLGEVQGAATAAPIPTATPVPPASPVTAVSPVTGVSSATAESLASSPSKPTDAPAPTQPQVVASDASLVMPASVDEANPVDLDEVQGATAAPVPTATPVPPASPVTAVSSATAATPTPTLTSEAPNELPVVSQVVPPILQSDGPERPLSTSTALALEPGAAETSDSLAIPVTTSEIVASSANPLLSSVDPLTSPFVIDSAINLAGVAFVDLFSDTAFDAVTDFDTLDGFAADDFATSDPVAWVGRTKANVVTKPNVSAPMNWIRLAALLDEDGADELDGADEMEPATDASDTKVVADLKNEALLVDGEILEQTEDPKELAEAGEQAELDSEAAKELAGVTLGKSASVNDANGEPADGTAPESVDPEPTTIEPQPSDSKLANLPAQASTGAAAAILVALGRMFRFDRGSQKLGKQSATDDEA